MKDTKFKKNDPRTKALGSKGGEARKTRMAKLEEFIVSGDANAYKEKMELLSRGEDISKAEQQFMDRSEKLFPYRFARKQEIDHTTDGEPITAFKIIDAI